MFRIMNRNILNFVGVKIRIANPYFICMVRFLYLIQE